MPQFEPQSDTVRRTRELLARTETALLASLLIVSLLRIGYEAGLEEGAVPGAHSTDESSND